MSYERTPSFLVGALAVLLSLALSCGRYSTERFSGESPVRSIEITRFSHTDEVFVELESGHNYTEFFDTGFFDGLQPGITLDEARSILGSPDSIRRTEDGEIFAEYVRERARIELSYQNYPSWGSSWKWKVRAFPESSMLSCHLPETVLRHLDSTRPSSITLLNPDGTPGVTIWTKGGEVDYVLWVNSMGSKRPRAQE